MPGVFPEPITNLPLADLPVEGLSAYLFQGAKHQLLFMEFSKSVDLQEHSHGSQWGIVLEGTIVLNIDGKETVYTKGDRYFIPGGVRHSARILAGYADITFFNEKCRYNVRRD